MSVIILLLGLVLPTLARMRALARRTSCGANVREVTRGAIAYGLDGSNHRGSTAYALPAVELTAGDAWWNRESGNPGSLWLLMKRKYLQGEVFVCPGAARAFDHEPMTMAGEPNGFAPGTLSYSYVSMVKPDGALGGRPSDAWVVTTESRLYPAEFIIVGDLNPRCNIGEAGFPNDGDLESVDYANSKNHAGEGQNVGRLDESADWFVQSSGQGVDDIYRSQEESREGDGLRASSDGDAGLMTDVFLIP